MSSEHFPTTISATEYAGPCRIQCSCGWLGYEFAFNDHLLLATAPTSDERFEQDDQESMALCLIAAEHDFTYREAGNIYREMSDMEKGKYHRMAYNALNHIGYLPSERRDRIRAQLPLDASVS